MDAQEAKRLVLEKYPMAKCIPDWLSGRQHAIYLHRVASDEPVGSAWCNSTDEAWIDAATRLSPQPETAQGEGCPWRFPSKCPDCNPKPDQQAQPQPAESDGLLKQYQEANFRQAAKINEITGARAEFADRLMAILGFTRYTEEYENASIITEVEKLKQRAEAAEAKLSSLLAQKPEATVSDDEETRRAIAEDRAFLHGMEAGWNLGVDENREEFNRRLEAGYKAIREANRELKAKDAEKGQGK